MAAGPSQAATDGELFWYITKGDVDDGMPSWKSLPEQERWEIVRYIRVLGGAKPGSPRVRMTASDGSLLVSDDGTNSIWRITYTGN